MNMTNHHNDGCETALKIECDCECGGRFHGIKSMRRIDEFFVDKEMTEEEDFLLITTAL